ncbi:inactive polyglycylase TTLL10 isoform X2 [Mesocricetus auratus]|uniref:Protein polyglycylase TTLL10 n=1 Tax=Mesocricetus auratus TaxID=10036 RepID=A0A3Q0D4Q9_MESAU|nr:inactive polyglycylase TTLL10 isoform X2 [Mesocricetus auratus]
MSSLPRAMSVSPELTPQKGHLLRSTENASPDSERCLGGTSPSKNVSNFSEPCVAKRCVWGKLQQNTDVVIFLAIFFRFKRISCPLYRGVISCRSFYLTSRHRGHTRRGRKRLTRHRRDAKMALHPQTGRSYGHHKDGSEPQAEATAQDMGKHSSLGRVGPDVCPIRGLGSQARRPRRGVGTTSPSRGPRPGTLMPATRSRTRFIHCRGQPPRTHVSSKRPKRSRIHRCHTRVPGWTHEKQMGSSIEEGLRPELSRLDQDADLLEEEEAARLPVTSFEGLFLEGNKQPNPGQGPFFYIGGTNGASIISSYCESKGWQRTQDSRCEDYKLKWCEIKCRDNYCSFREGQQLLFQLPNNKLLTTKIGLLSALREHARTLSKARLLPSTQAKVLKMEEFFPETYRLDIRDERQAFFTLFDETQIWICKPTASNQGKGIFLIRSHEEVAALQAKTQSIEDDPIYRKMPFRAPQARVVQRYVQNPLLLDGKKFDVRSYLLIACAVPYMVFFGHGYARLTLSLYDPHSSDLSGHLTNQFMQKKSPLYMLLKESTVWSMEHLNRYINDKFRKTKGLPRDWVFTTFTKRMQQIMAHCFLAVKSKLECKLGYFDLIGCDFLIDENFKVWLLEMNSNPALHTNCEVLKEVIPGVVMETLDLALETCQKSLHSQKMMPLLSQRHFVLLYNGETTDLWPRMGGSRHLTRLPPSALSSVRAADRTGARKPVPSRDAPTSGFRKSRQPDSSGGSGAESEPSLCSGSPVNSRDTAGESSLGPPEEEREEEHRSASHRGS